MQADAPFSCRKRHMQHIRATFLPFFSTHQPKKQENGFFKAPTKKGARKSPHLGACRSTDLLGAGLKGADRCLGVVHRHVPNRRLEGSSFFLSQTLRPHELPKTSQRPLMLRSVAPCFLLRRDRTASGLHAHVDSKRNSHAFLTKKKLCELPPSVRQEHGLFFFLLFFITTCGMGQLSSRIPIENRPLSTLSLSLSSSSITVKEAPSKLQSKTWYDRYSRAATRHLGGISLALHAH